MIRGRLDEQRRYQSKGGTGILAFVTFRVVKNAGAGQGVLEPTYPS